MRVGFATNFCTDRAHGFALLELLLALGLSSIMLLVLYNAQRHSQAVLVYSQQLHHANQLLSQVASQVWAYPQHYHLLTHGLVESDDTCLSGRHCVPTAITQAWATYLHQQILKKLPEGNLSFSCDGACVAGQRLYINLRWQQKLSLKSDECALEVACLQLKIAL